MKYTVLIFVGLLTTCGMGEDSGEIFATRNGGWVRLKGRGFVAAIDCRGVKGPAEYSEGIQKVKDAFQPDVRVVRGTDFALTNAVSQLNASGGNVAVFIVDDPLLPMSLTAQEERWTLINAAKAMADHPSPERLRKRLSVLFMRQCTRILGSDAAKLPETCHYHVFNLKDLDAIDTYDVGLGTSLCVAESMSRLGLEAVELVTYRDACELGKASAPTNDVQRRIWDEVHQLPKTPIKIKPETKKVAE